MSCDLHVMNEKVDRRFAAVVLGTKRVVKVSVTTVCLGFRTGRRPPPQNTFPIVTSLFEEKCDVG